MEIKTGDSSEEEFLEKCNKISKTIEQRMKIKIEKEDKNCIKLQIMINNKLS